MRVLTRSVLLFLSLTFSLVGLAKNETYYMIPHSGPGDPFWSIMHKGAMDAGKKLGVKVVFSAPDQPGDIAKQVSLLHAAIAARPAGIAVTVPDKRAFSSAIRSARKKGIPVIAFDTREDPRDRKGLPYQAYVGADEYQSGRKVGERALDQLKKGDRVVIATHQPGHMGLELRLKGISDVLRPAGVKVEKLDITSNPTKGVAIFRSFVKRAKNLKGIFALGTLGTVTVGKYLEESNSKGKYFFASFDLDDTTIRYLKEKSMNFSMDQMPYMQAYMVINQLHLAKRFAMTPVDMDTGGGFVTAGNAAQVEQLVKKGFR